jgi:hypothetical protein
MSFLSRSLDLSSLDALNRALTARVEGEYATVGSTSHSGAIAGKVPQGQFEKSSVPRWPFLLRT